MKQKFKNYLKLGILLFGVSLMLISCQKDDDLKNYRQASQSNDKPLFTVKRINKKTINKNRQVSEVLNRIKG